MGICECPIRGWRADQAHNGEIAESTKARPKLRDLLRREGLDHTPRLFEAETEGGGATGTAIAERAARRIETLEMGLARRNFLSVVESIQTTNRGQAMIDGLWRRLRLLVQLIPNIVQQSGFGDRGKGLRLALKPTSEARELISAVLSGLVFVLIKDDINQTIGLGGKLMELK